MQNFNRREILVFFLNILAKTNIYLLFALDEVEKIQEKSKLRFNQFLTSYRELIDLFNKIKGHYLITCFTDANGIVELQSANMAFYTRISSDIKELPPITEQRHLTDLVNQFNNLFNTRKNNEQLKKIVSRLNQFNLGSHNPRNRDLIRLAVELLNGEKEYYPLDELLKSKNLTNLFETTQEKLQLEGILKSIHQKFFDPLEYYLEANFLLNKETGNEIDRRDNQSFIDETNRNIHYFIFNNGMDIDIINKKINNLIDKHGKDIIIYSPLKLELSNSQIKLLNTTNKFEIVDYEPEKLFVLLNMYRDNFELQDKIREVVHSYTEENL